MLTVLQPRTKPTWPVAAVALAAIATVSGLLVADQRSSLSPEDLLAYEEQFLAVARDVGAVTDVGIAGTHSLKEAIGALDRGELRGEDVEGEAEIWIAVLSDADAALAELDVPSRLGTANENFRKSVDSYRKLAEILRKAGAANNVDTVDRLLDEAVELGERGDEIFDRGALVIQRIRLELGLEPNVALPDPPGQDPALEVLDPEDLYPEEYGP